MKSRLIDWSEKMMAKSSIIFCSVATIALVATVQLTGCGGDDDPPPPAEVTILKLEPSSGRAGNEIAVKGSGFENGIKVFFSDNKEAEVVSVTAAIINVIVPAGAVTGPVKVKTGDGREATSETPFTIVPSPTITDVKPLTVGMCDTITITGTNFTDDVKVFLNGGIEQPVASGTSTQLKAVVVGGDNGVVTLKFGDFTVTSAASLTVDNTPVILGASLGAQKGGDITLTGGFSTKTADIKVVINDVEYAPKAITVFSLTVTVPASMQVGDVGTIKVRNTALSKTSEARTFKVYTIFDGFNRPNAEATAADNPCPIGADWKVINYQWSITDNQVEGHSGGAYSYMVHNNALCTGLFRIETDIIIRADGNADWAGIVLNYIDEQNYYMFRICGIAAAFLHKVEGYALDDSSWDGVAVRLTGHTWYHIEISSTSVTRRFRIKITQNDNGEVLFDADVSDQKSNGALWNNGGKAGYYFGNFGLMDNFSFTKLD